jgi:hypothetical protein
MTDPDIDRYLEVLLRTLHTAEVSARADASVIRSRARTPQPLLAKIAEELRNLAPQLNHLADRAEELSAQWAERQKG